MTLSIFAQQIESMSRDKSEFESLAQKKLTEAYKSFVSATGVSSEEVFFTQGGFTKEINQIEVIGGEFRFEWVISIKHGSYELQAKMPVFAVQMHSEENEIQFGLGENSGNGGQEDSLFMSKLISLLHQRLANAFP
ncbi:hypothetical protein SOM41_22530 [Enterobacter sp. CFBP8995]|nr:hypothetical protein [Enterobacter sp. CFBP8995]